MADSVYEQIVQALVDRLEGIVGGGADYHYTPDQVLPVSWVSEAALRPDKEVKYLLVPDIEEEQDETFTRTASLMRLDLAACKRYGGKDIPGADGETRLQLQNKLAQDAKKRLRGNYTLNDGGTALSLHVKIPVTDRSAEETWHPSWAIVFLRLEVLYEYADTTP